MTKREWTEHIDLIIPTRILRPSQGGNKVIYHKWLTKHRKTCSQCKARQRTWTQNKWASAKHDTLTSLGLKRVVGALGGVYYE